MYIDLQEWNIQSLASVLQPFSIHCAKNLQKVTKNNTTCF